MTAPAQRLRDAARGMREKAEAARLGGWYADMAVEGVYSVVMSATAGRVARCVDGADAAYIAAMSPPVALAVADLLGKVYATVCCDEHFNEVDGTPDQLAALAVADAFLGVEHE